MKSYKGQIVLESLLVLGLIRYPLGRRSEKYLLYFYFLMMQFNANKIYFDFSNFDSF